jgi:hypothetical protein
MATRVRVRPVMDGPGPDEQIVAIQIKGGGEEEVILPKDFIQNDTLEVGRVGGNQDSVLIELPQESATGSWRLWVDPSVLT